MRHYSPISINGCSHHLITWLSASSRDPTWAAHTCAIVKKSRQYLRMLLQFKLVPKMVQVQSTLTIININYLNGRTQYVAIEGFRSTLLTVKTGVPQGSILGPVLFSIYINMCMGLDPVKIHLYADDTILYTTASLQVAMDFLQRAFNFLQLTLLKSKLVLNAKKTKFMIFNHSCSSSVYTLLTLDGTKLERVHSYKNLGIWLDDKLSFGVHIESILKTQNQVFIIV